MSAYYNEIDPYCAEWLRNLMAAGHIPAGDVDTRSIVDVRPDDLAGYTQCHFFAGLGGWAHAARLAGWPDDRPLWTGSPPCQPFSVAGKQQGQADARHLWPELYRLVAARHPAVLMGEQVARAIGLDWLDGVRADLEAAGYTCRAVVLPACAVDAPHRRDRLWFVADTGGERQPERSQCDRGSLRGAARQAPCGRDAVGSGVRGGEGDVALAEPDVSREGVGVGQRGGELGGSSGDPGDRDVGETAGSRAVGNAHSAGLALGPCERGDARTKCAPALGAGGGFWSRHQWIVGPDGKARRIEPGIRLLAHGIPQRVAKLRALGNAIVPILAAEIIAAWLETSHDPLVRKADRM